MNVTRDNLHHRLTAAPGRVDVLAPGVVSNLISGGDIIIHSYYYADNAGFVKKVQ